MTRHWKASMMPIRKYYRNVSKGRKALGKWAGYRAKWEKNQQNFLGFPPFFGSLVVDKTKEERDYTFDQEKAHDLQVTGFT
ncbi:hypothetical protein TH3_17375 [Thalassospira xiamenensis M-5 = DSM 17429]|uniref:Uncharacterized protein n=1 Tax=Thalassospira xiamenensis M-5 = DSM 17429 TaxID=1123366 RepID=A0AB72UH79_9PROT|nr:hypothetical protein [Thalassospira xiamenensis]AJD53577.1 hypothetical protein TH3_17375 [Thalassospira xiamenensis M-5 = DSM 17429]